MKRFCLCLPAFLLFAGVVHGQLFSDNFTRGTDPGPLTPWLTNAGQWTVTGGTMQAGLNPTFSYANAYITNNWTNYSVQAQFKFPAGAFGGGLGGRLTPGTGGHYGAWIYPEGSPGGSNVLRLLKFQNFTTFGYNGNSFTPVAMTNLASVGTTNHTVRMDFQGPQISVFLDGTLMISATDTESSYYTNGGVSLDMWTDSSQYLMTVDNVTVSNLVITAVPDSYNATYGVPLTVAAPGVLGNDTGGGGGALTAVLVTTAAHGTLNFNSNGSFTYNATNLFTGTDSFTYRATDGVSNSAPATVTITVGANHPPTAIADSYSVLVNTTLSVPAPGVLSNDSDVDGNAITAALVAGPTNGAVSLTNNGGFTYVPNPGYVGSDTFTYRASDGITNSATVAVNITVIPPALFYDDFTRGTDPGPLTPWIPAVGNWTNTAGTMRGGNNPTFSYGFAYITNLFSDYAVQARVQFPSNAFGGGIGSCFDSASGAHYAAWVYPENSTGGSNLLRLVKFKSYSSFDYNGIGGAYMAQTNLAAVGTGFHTVKLAVKGNRVAAYFDGVLMISTTDVEAQPFAGGSVSLDFWTDATPYIPIFDDVMVNNDAADDSYSVNENSMFKVSTPGLLANDTGVYGTNLTASLAAGPSHGTVTVTNNGGFQYTPTNNYAGPDSFTYTANDGTTNLGTATVSLNVLVVNSAPAFVATPTNRTIAELTLLTVTNNATDSDVPAQTLTYQLSSPPAGASIDTNGVITWTPSEAQGPGTYMITTIVTDSGFPPKSATNSFTVTVTEVNSAPVFVATPVNRTNNELTLITVTDNATDSDIPANTLTYSLLTAPTGANISSSGVFTWTPTEAQGPSTNLITVVVTDNGSPPLSATNSFTIFVNEVNSAPTFVGTPPNVTIPAQTTLTVTNNATDSDIPANNLTYSLINPPTGASVNPLSGVITWTPNVSQNNSSNLFRTRVVDDGSPPLSATNSFSVLVNSNPVVVLDSTALLVEGCSPTNGAIDPGEVVVMSFALKNIGTGPATNLMATLLATNGVAGPSGPQTYGFVPAGSTAVQTFSFSASGSCGGTISPTLRIQDGTLNLATNSVSFPLGQIVTVLTQSFDQVTVPALPTNWTTALSGVEVNWRTTNSLVDTPPNAAFAADVANIGVADLVSPVFVPSSGMQLSFRHRYDLESSPLTNTLGYDGGVLEIKIGTNDFVDITNAGGTFISGGYTRVISAAFGSSLSNRPAWSGTITSYSNVVVSLPSAAAGQSVQLRWRVATDNGGPPGAGWRVDSISVSGPMCCSITPPTLPVQNDQTIPELTQLIVTNTASDPSAPPGALSYSLTGPPGATIDTNGIIQWTPSEAQGPGTYTLTTIVTDSAFPPNSATNSFNVTVTEVNSPPVLTVPSNQVINELTLLDVFASATDSDIPTNTLTFSLISPPAGMNINPATGEITWTPGEDQGPSVNSITVVVTDDGTPNLSATNSFTVTVNEVNTAPVLTVPGDQTINELTTLNVSASATDADVPPNTLTFGLVTAPSGMTINTNTGAISWTPTEAQGPSTNTVTVRVTDNGQPPLSDTKSFTVFVNEVNTAPVLTVPADQTINDQATLNVSASATDSDIPTNTLTFSLVSAPTGMTINTNTGAISWTPTLAQAPSTNTVTVRVTDNGQPPLSDTKSFDVTVKQLNSAPVLPPSTNYTINELTTLIVTNTATDAETNALSYMMLSPPDHASIDTNGVITFSPDEAQGPGVYALTTVVTDNGTPNLSATNTITVTVNEVNSAPLLTVPGTQMVNESDLLSVYASATDSDIPANTLTFSLVSPPAGMSISPTTGLIQWVPGEAQGPSTNSITVVVTDDGSPNLSTTNSFTVIVLEVNSPPVLTVPTNQTVAALATLDVFASATDSDIPTNTLTFSLLSPPTGLTINPATGEIIWTPTQNQGPGTNDITVVVTDNGQPPMSATNSFIVVVTAADIAPPPMITSVSVSGGVALLNFTSVSNHVYRLQFKSELTDANWTDVSPDITATNSTATCTNVCGPADQRLYRLQVVH